MGLSAYKNTIKRVETPRQVERRILSQVTSELAAEQEAFEAADMHQRLTMLNDGVRSSLSRNLDIWSVMKVDLVSPTNQMAPELRASLISMAMFIERQTAKLLAGEGSLSSIVAINRSIIAGLAATPKEEE